MSFDLRPITARFDGAPAGLDLDALAATVDRIGIDGVLPAVLDRLAARARTAGVHPDVAALLTDAGAPEVVRRRAFGHVSRRLATVPGPVDAARPLAA